MTDTPSSTAASFDAVVVGAGFAGLYMLHRLRKLGLNARVLEAGSGIGGTWFWNRYPGARCDIQSMEYSYKFAEDLAQEWNWSERYATQPEIMQYLNHVADRFELRSRIQFNTRVKSAIFSEQSGRWTIATEAGEQLTARFCIMATGCLSSTNLPSFKGIDSFKGPTYHTGRWPHHGVDFTGLKVTVIGTGSSAIQSIPLIAEQAAQLHVFQRTANYSVPAHNQNFAPAERDAIKANYADLRERGLAQPLAFDIMLNPKAGADLAPEEFKRELDARWAHGGLPFYGTFIDLITDPQTNARIAEYIREKIRATVKDPAVAELLCPKGIFGCKRICVDTGYYETYNRPNVTLVDVSKNPIEEITPEGVKVDGKVYAVDAIVFATGFDAMTGSLEKMDIRGRGGVSLKSKWSAGPRTYLGLTSVGFPNLFTISGPGSPSVLTNMVMSIEQHVDFITDCIEHMRKNNLQFIEPELDAQDQWVDHVNDIAGATLFYSCNSWYLGANVPGKPRVFMPYFGFPAYAQKCREIVANDYQGFALTAIE